MPKEGAAEPLRMADWSSPDEYALIEQVGAYDPDLARLLTEHIKEEGGYVLSTLFLSDVVRWANELFVAGHASRVSGLLALLERHYANGDRYVRELIGVGFVEMMDAPGAPTGGMRALLGPHLATEYAQSYPRQ